jgi:hypothetical protein
MRWLNMVSYFHVDDDSEVGRVGFLEEGGGSWVVVKLLDNNISALIIDVFSPLPFFSPLTSPK